MDDQKIRLALEILGTDGVADLRTKLNALNAEGGELSAAFGRGELSAKEFEAEMKRVAASTRNLESSLKQLEKAAETSGNKMAGFGQSALQSGRVVQDFAQGGLGGILNNIEGFTQAIGGGAGLSGVLTILGVGLLVLKPQITAFIDSLTGGTAGVQEFGDKVKGLEDRIKALEETKGKVAIDVHELEHARQLLDDLKKGQAEYDAGQHKQTVLQAESGKLVQEQIDEVGQAQFEKDLKSQIASEQLASSLSLKEARDQIAQSTAALAEAKEDLKTARTPEAIGAADAARVAAQAGIESATAKARDIRNAIEGPQGTAEQAAGLLIKNAREGNSSDANNQARAQDELARRTGRHFDSPEELERFDAESEDFGRSMDRAKDAGQARRDAARRQKKEDDEQAKRDEKDRKDTDALEQEGAEGLAKHQEKAAKEAAKEAAKATGTEADRIVRTLGKPRQAEYEALLAGDTALRANGGPMARNSREEKQFQQLGGRAGVDYALPPDVLEKRLRAQMEREFTNRHASPQAAQEAAKRIGDRGNEDLGKRAAEASMTGANLGIQTLQVQGQLVSQYQRIDGMQKQMKQMLQQQSHQMRSGAREQYNR